MNIDKKYNFFLPEVIIRTNVKFMDLIIEKRE